MFNIFYALFLCYSYTFCGQFFANLYTFCDQFCGIYAAKIQEIFGICKSYWKIAEKLQCFFQFKAIYKKCRVLLESLHFSHSFQYFQISNSWFNSSRFTTFRIIKVTGWLKSRLKIPIIDLASIIYFPEIKENSPSYLEITFTNSFTFLTESKNNLISSIVSLFSAIIFFQIFKIIWFFYENIKIITRKIL